ncbi:hypothetical protein [Stieleria mannarensis]|uniref:hypothetical protein n=1 Tax=Stieleria mannarensis TaxID=2755585 RepID=UPI0016007BD9|nr:hypothetical protein [Rhodopirellula sp. JC639]
MSLNSPLTRPITLPQRRRCRSAKAVLLGSLLSGVSAVSVLASPQATAGETACRVCPPASGQARCDCGSCDGSGRLAKNPIYTTLDTVAGGIEKLLGLEQCGNSACTTTSCDGGCDSAPWMMGLGARTPSGPHGAIVPQPIPAPPTAKPMARPPATLPPATTPPLPSAPSLAPAPPKAAPVQPPPTTLPPAPTEPLPPRTVPSEASPVESPDRTLPEPENAVPDSFPMPPAEPEPQPKKEGSIFDALDDLDDPFKEDAAQLMRQYGSIRPMLERASKAMTPEYLPVYPTPRRSVQIADKPEQAVGSGLRRANHAVAPLRPVSHEEPVQLRPMTSRRVLAPYRPSR